MHPCPGALEQISATGPSSPPPRPPHDHGEPRHGVRHRQQLLDALLPPLGRGPCSPAPTATPASPSSPAGRGTAVPCPMRGRCAGAVASAMSSGRALMRWQLQLTDELLDSAIALLGRGGRPGEPRGPRSATRRPCSARTFASTACWPVAGRWPSRRGPAARVRANCRRWPALSTGTPGRVPGRAALRRLEPAPECPAHC